MAGEENKREVTLRSGAVAEAGSVMGVLRLLQGLAEHNPEYFHLLLDISRGENPTDYSRVMAELKRAGAITPDGSVRPLFRDVLLSACRETPEGIVVGSPFAPQDEAEAAYVQTHVTASEDRLVRFTRKLGLDRPPNGGGGPGH